LYQLIFGNTEMRQNKDPR